jgi:hypothetical protein
MITFFKDGLRECSSSMELDVPVVIKNSLDKPVTHQPLQSPFQYMEKNNRTLFKDYKLLDKVWNLAIAH